jgi:hypothetical protein
MKRLALVFLVVPVAAQGAKLHVDAAAPAGGDGSRRAPFARIADALAAGRPLAASERVTIDVAPGEYAAEPRPLVFDFPVTVRGPLVLARDDAGLATGAFQDAATVRGTAGPDPVLLVTGRDVTLRGLRVTGTTPPTGTGIAADKAVGFTIQGVHLSGFVQGVLTSASSGRFQDSFIGPPMGSAAVLAGGNDAHPADVRFARNRGVDHGTGALALLSAADPILPREPFHTLAVTIDGNHFHTTRTSLGPSNPYGLRANLIFTDTTSESHGVLVAKVTGNVLSGSHRYPLIVNGGQIERAGVAYTATVQAAFSGNAWLAGANTVSRVLLSFTNSRMGLAPFWNELDPVFAAANGLDSAQYLEGSLYELRHDGELDACLAMDPASTDCRVDHPAIEPCDDRVLENAVVLRGAERVVLPNATFIPDVCP